MTPKQYGIPNSRLRYYLVARRSPFIHSPQTNIVQGHIPSCHNTEHSPVESWSISHYLDDPVDESTFVPDRTLQKWGKLFDIVVPSGCTSCCFTRGMFQSPYPALYTEQPYRIHSFHRRHGVYSSNSRRHRSENFDLPTLSLICHRHPRCSTNFSRCKRRDCPGLFHIYISLGCATSLLKSYFGSSIYPLRSASLFGPYPSLAKPSIDS